MSNSLRRLWRRYRNAGGVLRELTTALLCLLIGLVVMPCLIFAVGRLILGPYANGGVFPLWHDFLNGLAAGSTADWFVALGPYLLALFVRFGLKLLHN